MEPSAVQTAIYPGAFDPVTRGHLDIIERAACIFQRLVVAVGENPAKTPLFTTRERCALLKTETRHLKNVEIRSFSGLLVDFARRVKSPIAIRAIRSVSDYEYELQMAFANRAVSGLETLFMAPRPERRFLSARLIREIASMGGDVGSFLTPNVEKKLRAKLQKAAARRGANR